MVRGGITAFVALLVIAAVISVSGQANEDCMSRTVPVGVSIAETVAVGESKTFLSLLAYFGGSVDANTPPMPVVVADDKFACKPIGLVTGKAVLVWRGDCPFIQKAVNAQAAGAAAVIVVTDETELSSMSCVGNSSITIPVMQVLNDDGAQLAVDAGQGANVTLKELSIKSSMDFVASFALLSIASMTIIFGAVWSLSDQRLMFHPKSENDGERGQETAGATEGLEITEMSAAYFVVFASLVLLVIFYTMQHWVFVVIKGVFCFAAVQGLQALFFAVFVSIFKPMSQDVELPVIGKVHVLSIPSVACSLATVGIWVVNQGATWAWILQDIMGMSFLVNVLRLVHLPNLKVGALLLSGAMCYDIFWVYIQPHLFGDESVMVKVAKGGDKHESLPMLFLFPRLEGNVGDFSMLGYGDVILPGLLIVHNHLFDNRSNESNRARISYLLPSIAAYIAGLLLTFLALYFEVGGQGGQPALCYLVPTVLGGTVFYAHCRGELKEMWTRASVELISIESESEGERLIGTGSTNSNAAANV
eukprot:CAMPEP_0181392268 /NCGR_PEP_ID=MMETSP1106-20121128/26492_1 /TAXON_ID=81844 /ORGANISM="Mantoniella antarctica, Strain SL-175" /LENGTH=532 /DNA_ID=CAMNT_0023513363 /DNA_START=211 /DNA_END=1809 /DNA_ORIENTATION=+